MIASLAATAVLASAGCGPGAPAEPPPQPKPQASAKSKAPAARNLPSRLLSLRGPRPEVIARFGAKNLYLVDEERWLVDASGKTERAPMPIGERLEGAIPFAQAGLAAIGWSWTHAFSFDDVLGAPKMVIESEIPFHRVRPGPNAMILFTEGSPAMVDLSTGLQKGGSWPAFPVRDAMFVDDRRGVAATAVGGIGTTTDGGKTWRPADHEVATAPSLELIMEAGAVHVKEEYSNRIARVDIDRAEIGDWTAPGPASPRALTPIERWITAFGNPIASAVRNGIDAGGGTGVVAWGDTVARVDLATGLFTETAAFAGTEGECRGAMSGKEAYFVCGANGKRARGEQLWRVRTDGKLEMERIEGATFGGRGDAGVLGSGAGGLLVLQGCGDKWGSFCVRQPNGNFAQVEPEDVRYPEAAAPLADGRVVNVGVRTEATGPVLELIACSAHGSRVLEEASFDDQVFVRVTRPEEGEDGVVRFLVKETPIGKKDEYRYLYAYQPGKKGFRKTALPDGAGAVFGDGVLITAAEDGTKARVSHDLGAMFRALDLPAGMLFESTITRLGLVAMGSVRVGWDPVPAEAPPAAPAPSMRIGKPKPFAPEAVELSCTASGPAKTGTMLPADYDDLAVDFGVGAAPRGVRRAAFSSAKAALDPTLLLLVEGKEPKPGAEPAQVQADRWVVYWLDPAEPGAKVRHVSVKAPYPDMQVRVGGVWASGGKLFFTVDVGDKEVLVRLKGSGIETAAVHPSMLPSRGSAQSFSRDGNVIAYLAGGALFVWKSGEAPRPIAALDDHGRTLLGEPTKDGVAVFADVEQQSYYKVFPIPSDKPAGAPEEQRVRASWDGWTRSMTLVGGRGPVRFCGAKPSGSWFHSTRSGPLLFAQFAFDGSRSSSTPNVRYDVATDGQSFCVERLTVVIWNGNAINVKSGGATKRVEGIDFFRVNALGDGELTRTGKLDKVPLYAMKCAEAPPAN